MFRKDINGLRAIAVIAVVLFHFNPAWMPGGFAGVDVFFVISGFLMTGIIFKGIEKGHFSIIKFYIARANRIIPPLSVLCLVLLLFCWFYLTPIELETLGKHVASSLSFLSNVIYWRESGYFDASSHEKWLLHTWSLSVEWQFYIIYPLVLVLMRKLMSVKAMKQTLLIGTLLGFIFCVISTYKWPNPSYYLLPTRAWEMMLGGIAYLYPLSIKEKRKKIMELLGFSMIIGAYILFSKVSAWPGYLSIFPVLGTFFIIQAKNSKSFITNNIVFQKLGTWSYSIYLWHWPIVVAIYYFSLNDFYIYFGIFLSILFGYLSYKYIEKINFRNDFNSIISYLKFKPLYMAVVVFIIGILTFLENGFIKLAPYEYQWLVQNASQSPYKEKCHIGEYTNPKYSCEYFGTNISWATLGDSHSVEIAYALAEKLKLDGVGLKHFSFSGCTPSYQEKEIFTKCSKWYNESVNYIINDKNIINVVVNHRYINFFNGISSDYSQNEFIITEDVIRMTENFDKLILKLASVKNNVYIFYPIPELTRNIKQLIGIAYRNKDSLLNIVGSNKIWYNQRNEYIINHLKSSIYPDNVHLLNPSDIFCDDINCYAVKDGVPLYFDSHHISVLGAAKLVDLIRL